MNETRTDLGGLRQELNGRVLVLERRRLVVEPAELLQHLGVLWVLLQHALVGLLGFCVLRAQGCGEAFEH